MQDNYDQKWISSFQDWTSIRVSVTENVHYNFEFSVVLFFRLAQVFAKAQKDPVTYNNTQ